MGSETKRKIKIITLSIILAILVIAIIAFATIQLINRAKDDNPDNSEPNNTVVTTPNNPLLSNSYNEAISRKMLTTYDYSGTYIFDESVYVIFNEYSESNPNGLTADEIDKILKENGCNNRNEFRNLLDKDKFYSITGEEIIIEKPMNDETGSNQAYGYYTIKNNNGTTRGKVYGDKNLAVIVKDSDESAITFISLNYKKMSDATGVHKNDDRTDETLDGKIYVFENYYENGRLLYSATYTYKIK